MRTKRSHEGYLIIDHRAGNGLDEISADQAGKNTLPVRPGSVLESATITCSHCCAVVVLNPDRSRERGFCPKCDHYICDGCEAVRAASGGECRTFAKLMDDVCEAAIRGKNIILSTGA